MNENDLKNILKESKRDVLDSFDNSEKMWDEIETLTVRTGNPFFSFQALKFASAATVIVLVLFVSTNFILKNFL